MNLTYHHHIENFRQACHKVPRLPTCKCRALSCVPFNNNNVRSLVQRKYCLAVIEVVQVLW